jgi:hypothetical protein
VQVATLTKCLAVATSGLALALAACSSAPPDHATSSDDALVHVTDNVQCGPFQIRRCMVATTGQILNCFCADAAGPACGSGDFCPNTTTPVAPPPALAGCTGGMRVNVASTVWLCPENKPITPWGTSPIEDLTITWTRAQLEASNIPACFSNCVGYPNPGWKIVIYAVHGGDIGSGAAGPVDLGKSGGGTTTTPNGNN